MLRILTGWVRRLSAAPASWYLVLLILGALIFSFHISTKPAYLSPKERITSAQSRSLRQIQHNPLDAPYKLLVFSLSKVGFSAKPAARLSSAIFGLIFVFCFYWLAKTWFGRFIGLLGTAILTTTPLFFILARSGTGEIMLASIIIIMAAYIWLTRTQDHYGLAFTILLLVCALSVYVPGVIWWMAGAAVICRKKIAESVSAVPVSLAAAITLVSMIIILPLILGLVKDTALIKQLLLLPMRFPDLIDSLKNFGWMLSAMFFKSPDQNGLLLGRLPVLSIMQTALLAFGAFALWSSAGKKAFGLALTVVFAAVLAAINNNLSILLIALPALGIFVTAGLRYLFLEWRAVFPLNPVAKGLSFALLAAVVAVNIFYGLKYSIEAWPHSVPKSHISVLK